MAQLDADKTARGDIFRDAKDYGDSLYVMAPKLPHRHLVNPRNTGGISPPPSMFDFLLRQPVTAS